ncbi:hypothetical protein [Pseudoalteromonas luteoviolacea]|uniref:Uncharacterized protein n=1 Tax=Pseudoalteromonas luteoviolacea S4060-1 TaxID=1365257 RepID=A0A167PBI5_9GAMM|nr:hypothetical protein [Pseudoalteromonas luteoviolacea]KZN70320.1 hypothetical protein N478_00020 [Pseudoalteromonas luteoviolacea S4060-1]
MNIKEQAIKKLANSMRIYVETHIDFQRLKAIDIEEAVDNLDRAFEAKLEAFHSLYDVTKDDFDYFSYGDIAAIILMRNAIHHRDHHLFQSWNYNMALDEGYKNHLGAEFLLAGYDVSDSPARMRHFYKLEDFYLRIDEKLNSRYIESRMGSKNRKKLLSQLNAELNFSGIKKKAESELYPIKQVYVNVIPIFISAVCRVFTVLKQKGVEFKGFDAKVYEAPLTDELQVDFSKTTYEPLRIT